MKRSVALDTLAAAAIAALNIWISWRLFLLDYTPAWSSIEGSFIGLARHLTLHWGDWSWFNLWHCGMPFQDTYAPLVHLAVAAVATVTTWSAAHSYHAVTGLAYSLGPVALYFLARRLDAARPAALWSALAFSLFSPSTLIFPEFAVDLGSRLAGRRLQVMCVYGEGPHIAAITLMPVALLALEHALRRRTLRAFALAALSIGLVFLTNIPGTMALALAVWCWISIQPAASRWAALRLAAGASALGYAVVCFGWPPSSVATLFANVGPMHSGFSRSLHQTPYLLPGLLAATAFAGWLLARTFLPLYARLGALYAALTTVLALTARNSDQFEILPQAGRLHLEIELAIALLIGWLCWLLWSFSPRRPVRAALALIGIAVVIFQIGHYRWRARIDLKPVDPATRSEYTTARWIDAHLGGRRVYSTGSTGFWLNAFTDTPQMTGCCDQGNSMPVLATVPTVLHMGVSPVETRRAITWLQALGVHALIVNGPASSDEYKDYHDPARFDGLLTIIHQERGDTIYAIPQRSVSLAHVIRAADAPRSASDEDAARYASALQDPARPEPVCDWLTTGHARIRAHLDPGDVLSVQTAWYRGWNATMNGAAQPASPDGIGFILIRPQCQGACEIDLRWTGPWDFYLAALISILSLVVVLSVFIGVHPWPNFFPRL